MEYILNIKRKVWPKHHLSDQIAFSFTNIGLVGIVLFELLVVLPIYHAPFSFMYTLHVACASFLAINVLTNMYTMILTDATVRSPELSLPSVLRNGWYYCPVCQMNAPPRAHHCPLCQVCIIKRDHHCIFTGNCVGYSNHRYFLWMVFYLWVGSVYAILFNLDYFGNTIGQLAVSTVLKLIFPFVAWSFGYSTFHQLAISIIAGVCVLACFLFTCLLTFQSFLLLRGQTQFECQKSIKHYHAGFYNNMRVILGKRWYLTWLSPCMSSPLLNDGTEFTVVQAKYADAKSY